MSLLQYITVYIGQLYLLWESEHAEVKISEAIFGVPATGGLLSGEIGLYIHTLACVNYYYGLFSFLNF